MGAIAPRYEPHAVSRGWFLLIGVLLALGSVLPAWAQTQRLERTRQVLKQEVPFRAFDKVQLGEAERCPPWIEVRAEEGESASCRRLDVVYRNIYLSGIYVEHPEPVSNLVIYHAGHESTRPVIRVLKDAPLALIQPDAARLVSQVYSRSANVLILFMPGFGLDPSGESEAVRRLFAIVNNHSAFSLLDYSGDSALAYFVAHVRGFLDRYGSGFKKVVMMGRSGGGWATTMAAALDGRISCSVSFFGSLPLQLRLPVDGDGTDDLGDFEQFGLMVYRGLDYLDFYALAGSRGRPHILVYNEVDDCCFSGAVKGRMVKPLFDRMYPDQRTLSVSILPKRSEADHYNLDAMALAIVENHCGLRESE